MPVEGIASNPAATPVKLPWFAVQVRSRKEDWVASQLVGQGLECFLPKYKAVRRWSDRMKELDQPLFPGYLFCRFDFQARRPIVVTPGVIQILSVGRAPTPIDETEIAAIQQAISSGLPSQPWPYVAVGERVRVTYGNLTGLEGLLIKFKGNHRVVLSVTLLQRSVAMEVDLAWVTPLRAHQEKSATEIARPVVTVPALS